MLAVAYRGVPILQGQKQRADAGTDYILVLMVDCWICAGLWKSPEPWSRHTLKQFGDIAPLCWSLDMCGIPFSSLQGFWGGMFPIWCNLHQTSRAPTTCSHGTRPRAATSIASKWQPHLDTHSSQTKRVAAWDDARCATIWQTTTPRGSHGRVSHR